MISGTSIGQYEEYDITLVLSWPRRLCGIGKTHAKVDGLHLRGLLGIAGRKHAGTVSRAVWTWMQLGSCKVNQICIGYIGSGMSSPSYILDNQPHHELFSLHAFLSYCFGFILLPPLSLAL